MTLLIDGYTITGTPEEINAFIKIYKKEDTGMKINYPPYVIQPLAQTLDPIYTNKITEDSGTNTAITIETL